LLGSVQELGQALNQLQPSLFTSLAVAQESDTLTIRETITRRMENVRHQCCEIRNNGFWVAPLFARMAQKTHHYEPGFAANSGGFFTGADGALNRHCSIGGGIGFLHDDLHWYEKRGKSNTTSAYSALYSQWNTAHGYVQAGLIGGYNYYKTTRNIQFGSYPTISRQARGSHQGLEGAGYLQLGAKAIQNWVSFSPFACFDYLFLHEQKFTEKGAKSLNLFIDSKNAALLSSQLGIDFWCCKKVSDLKMAPFNNMTVMPYAQLSVIRESRFQGSHENAKFEGVCPMSIVGYYPSRTLGGAVAGFDCKFDQGEFSLSYQGKYGSKFNDNAFFLEVLLSW
jgi:outer membrane autotransporter protein